MLKTFRFRNFMSFYAEQIVDFTVTSLNNRENSKVVPLERPNKSVEKVLKSAAFYGANAAGKSNLVYALGFVQHAVRNALGEKNNVFSVDLQPFKASSTEETSEFEVEFFYKESLFSYGFEVSKNGVHSEWLYQRPGGSGKPRTLLERVWNSKSGSYEYYTPSLRMDKRNKDFVFSKTMKNELILAKGNSLQIDQISDVYEWFEEILLVIPRQADKSAREQFRATIIRSLNEDNSEQEEFESLILKLDLGFEKFNIIEKDNTISDINSPEMQEMISDILEKRREKDNDVTREDVIESIKELEPQFLTKIQNRDFIFLINELSDGSRKLFDFAGPIKDVIKRNRTLIIDEFNESVHPLLMKKLIDYFLSFESSRSQLLFTTHDVVLMDMCFERDQIFFVEKSTKLKTSEIYSLTDFGVRREAHFSELYLSGLLGAVPEHYFH